MKKTLITLTLIAAMLLSSLTCLAEPSLADLEFGRWQTGSEDGKLFLYCIVSGAAYTEEEEDAYPAYCYAVVDGDGLRLAISPDEPDLRAGNFANNPFEEDIVMFFSIASDMGLQVRVTGTMPSGSHFFEFGDDPQTPLGSVANLAIPSLRASGGLVVSVPFLGYPYVAEGVPVILRFFLPGYTTNFRELYDAAAAANWQAEGQD